MPFDPSALKPLLDQVLTPGELTTEYAQMKSATWGARLMWGLGLLGLAAGGVSAAFGTSSKAGIIAAGIATACGVGMEVMVNLGYSKARTQQKADAQVTVQVATQEANKP